MRVRRRGLLRVAALMLLGAICSVLSAAAVSFKECVREARRPAGTSIGVFVVAQAAAPARRVVCAHESYVGYESWIAFARNERYPEMYAQDKRARPWPSFLAEPADDDSSGTFATACGWPMYSMYWRGTRTAAPGGGITSAPEGLHRARLFGANLLLPLLPLWPGLLVDTAFYSAALGAVMFGVSQLRRQRRRRRGLCIACGYDLRDAVQQRCPECGRVVRTSGSNGL